MARIPVKSKCDNNWAMCDGGLDNVLPGTLPAEYDRCIHIATPTRTGSLVTRKENRTALTLTAGQKKVFS